MKFKRVIISLIMCSMLVTALGAIPSVSAQQRTYSDVSQGEWFYDSVMTLSQFGIIDGYPDGTFKPNKQVSRGEFIKMLTIASEYLYTTTPDTGVHWAESYWNCLNEAKVLEIVETDVNKAQYAYPIIQLNYQELEKNIPRYEMAYLINRVLYTVYYENQMKLKDDNDSYANHIADYNTMNKGFQGSVEQVYAKGVLTGYEDSSFKGENVLTRAEAATVIVRLMWNGKREAQAFAVERKPEPVPDPTFTSFAFQYRTMSNYERRLALFGDPNKTYFTGKESNLANYFTVVKVRTWDIDSRGNKYTRWWNLSVHKLVAKEVTAIFEEIYNDPEKFPIHALGGARFSDTLRHSWGCAIDINPVENYYINYKTGQTVGSYCYKNGSSPYCITPNGSVVRAFARYGWGWGGQGWSTAADYMHFSILASGG